MKKMLFILLYILTIPEAEAQVQMKQNTEAAESPVAISVASGKINRKYIAPHSRLKAANASGADIEVTYVGFPEEARQAFEYAVSIWEGLITSPVPVKILARWDEIDGNVLALGRPSAFYVNFENRPRSHVYYPVALAEKLSGKDLNNGQPDILCTFNSRYPWYFGTDGNTPVTAYDFVSSALHEITHGLGFSGFLNDENGAGFFDNANNLPSIYDYYIFNSSNQQISDKTLFNSPSVDLHRQLVSDELKIYEPESTSEKGWIYAPATWKEGMSIYHLKDGSHSLMGPYAHKGQAIHQPEKSALDILSEIGWKSVVFEFEEVNDFEQACEELPLNIGLISDFDIDSSSVRLFFSADYFTSIDSVSLNYDRQNRRFYGNLPLKDVQGNVQYYFAANAAGNRRFTWPAQAPGRLFSFRVGPDYAAPAVDHNPQKIVSSQAGFIGLTVRATDNIGIRSIAVEYKIDGQIYDPVYLIQDAENTYKGSIILPAGLTSDQKVEYRIITEDSSVNSNKRIIPSGGFYSVGVFDACAPVSSYSNDFENLTNDFVLADFTVGRIAGFSGSALHSRHPYPVSAFGTEKYNLEAQLKYPVIVEENGQIVFDEVLLAEPSGSESDPSVVNQWDFAVVEGSTDYGKTWLPVSETYDSGVNENWATAFNSALTNGTSVAVGNEGMALKRILDICGNGNFKAGDTVIFRFRFASDNTVNGWGWSIDNLSIQGISTAAKPDIIDKGLRVYPNPFASVIWIDCSNMVGKNPVDLIITDLTGRVVYQRTNADISGGSEIQIDLSGQAPGIYLVRISSGNRIYTTEKIIKNL